MRPRVLFINHSAALGGGELSLLDIARYYSMSSRVVLFADGPFRKRLVDADVAVDVLPAPQAVMEVPREGSIMQDLYSVPSVLKLAQHVARLARGYDLLYANSLKALVVGALAGKIAGKPMIWHARDMLTAEELSWAHRWLAVTLANRLARRIIANSRATAAAFVECGGQPKNLRVVYNGIDPTPFEAVTSAEVGALRQELNLTGAPTIGVFSRLAPWKGQHVLLEALTYLPEVQALVVGEAIFGEYAYARTLREQTKTLGISDRVHFLGFRQDIPQLMRLSDVVVHTSIASEPFGRVIVEGLLARRPVVATRGGGVVEIIEDGVSGVLVPRKDPTTLAEALDDLLKHPTKAHNLAEAGYSAALPFSLQGMLDSVSQEIQEVALAKS